MNTATKLGALRIEFAPDWHREVVAETTALAFMERALEGAVAAAKALAPVGQGDYRESIGSRVEKVEGRWVGVVGATDFKTVWIERGADSPTYVTPAVHPIQRGVESQGIRVTPG